jgi:hypothetical protein
MCVCCGVAYPHPAKFRYCKQARLVVKYIYSQNDGEEYPDFPREETARRRLKAGRGTEPGEDRLPTAGGWAR